MSHFDNVIDKLKQDNEVPQQVLEKLDAALASLPDKRKSSIKYRKYKIAAAAVAFIAGISFCCSNPALAARIPIIGKIFEKIEDDVPFSGDYSEKAESLKNENMEVGVEHAAEQGITITDKGISVTAAEVYCDGLSVFLTMQVHTEQGGLQNIPISHVVGKDTVENIMYLNGEWKVSGDSEFQMLVNNNLEGKVLDENTFIGMVKLDLHGDKIEQGTLNLQLSGIGWDDNTVDNAQDISVSHAIDGQWNFAIPFRIDKASVREIELNQEKNGYTIRKVFVSPYQIVTYVDAPVTKIEKNITREDYEGKLGLAEGEEDADMSYEEFVAMYEEQESRAVCETIICDQDGKILPAQDMSITSGQTTFAVNGKKISVLHIYVLESNNEYEEYGDSIPMDVMAQKAVVSAEIASD